MAPPFAKIVPSFGLFVCMAHAGPELTVILVLAGIAHVDHQAHFDSFKEDFFKKKNNKCFWGWRDGSASLQRTPAQFPETGAPTPLSVSSGTCTAMDGQMDGRTHTSHKKNLKTNCSRLSWTANQLPNQDTETYQL